MIKNPWHSTIYQSSVFIDLTETEWKHHNIFSFLHRIFPNEQYNFLEHIKSKTFIELVLMGHYTTVFEENVVLSFFVCLTGFEIACEITLYIYIYS